MGTDGWTGIVIRGTDGLRSRCCANDVNGSVIDDLNEASELPSIESVDGTLFFAKVNSLY